MQTIKFNGQTINTRNVGNVRFSCVFAGTLKSSFKQGIRVDDKGEIKCTHCGQSIHETNVKEILSQL